MARKERIAKPGVSRLKRSRIDASKGEVNGVEFSVNNGGNFPTGIFYLKIDSGKMMKAFWYHVAERKVQIDYINDALGCVQLTGTGEDLDYLQGMDAVISCHGVMSGHVTRASGGFEGQVVKRINKSTSRQQAKPGQYSGPNHDNFNGDYARII